MQAAQDIRCYRDAGFVAFDYEVPRPTGRPVKLDIQDQGLVIEAIRNGLNLWLLRVNPAGGDDVVFPPVAALGDPGRLKVQLCWRRGGQMALWVNDAFVAFRPFRPPLVN